MKHLFRRLPLATLAALLSLVAACHDNDGKIGPESAIADVVVRDAPVDELLTFSAELAAIRLRDDVGDETENLLSEPATIDLLSLRDVFGWFSSRRVPNGTYTAVVLDFSPASFEAVDLLGRDVAVFALGSRLVAPLLEPVEITGSYRRLEVDVDLRESILGDVAQGLIGFRPRGVGAGQNGVQPTPVDEIKGIVRTSDPAAQRLTVDAFVDGDMRVPLGTIEVRLDAATMYVQQSGNLFASAASFLGSLVPGVSQVEVHGSMIQRGVVRADRVDVEDRAGTGSTALVELEGDVVIRYDERVFELRVRRVRKGEELFTAAVGPRVFALIFVDVTTTVLQEFEDGSVAAVPIADTSVLFAGQRVKVKLSDVSFEPFFASNLVIRSPFAEYPGELTRATGQSTLLEARIDDTAAAVLAGEISPVDPVELDVAQAELTLGTIGAPSLSSRDLVPGLDVTIQGAASGPPDAVTIAPARVLVRAGSLVDASVDAIDRADSSFTTVGGTIVQSFGNALVSGPLRVELEPGAVFLGDATSEEELFDLFDGLSPTQGLNIRVDGLSDRTPTGVRAFEIEATVGNVPGPI